MKFVYNNDFDNPFKIAEILGEVPNIEDLNLKRTLIRKKFKQSSSEFGSSRCLHTEPILSGQQEKHFFLKMNYLKYLANKNDSSQYDQEIKDIENQIIFSNIRLAIPIIKKKLKQYSLRFYPMELISDCYMFLKGAVERFDVNRGIKFSTYAFQSISNNFSRIVYKSCMYQQKQQTSCDMCEMVGIVNSLENVIEDEDNRKKLSEIMECLTKIDDNRRKVFKMFYGIGCKSMQMRDIAAELGFEYNYVRNLKLRADRIIRKLIGEKYGNKVK